MSLTILVKRKYSAGLGPINNVKPKRRLLFFTLNWAKRGTFQILYYYEIANFSKQYATPISDGLTYQKLGI